MPTASFIVSGRVQCVGYRASARMHALQLGLCGHALNRPDGSVEVLASGAAEALDALQRWLQRGPPAARIEAVHREELPERELRGFATG